jgi:undecaprenyl-diphosphatase
MSGICIFLILVFLLLCFLVKYKYSLLTVFDSYFTGIVRDNLYPRFNFLFLSITQFGNFIFVLIVTAVCLTVFLVYKKIIEAIWLLSGVIIVSGFFVQVLKIIIGRERPNILHLVIVNDLSFPSGHSTASMILYGTIIILVNTNIKNYLLKRIVQILLIMLIFSVGISRIYCGVHFPTDVIGGFLLGLIWLCFSYTILQDMSRYNSYYGKTK